MADLGGTYNQQAIFRVSLWYLHWISLSLLLILLIFMWKFHLSYAFTLPNDQNFALFWKSRWWISVTTLQSKPPIELIVFLSNCRYMREVSLALLISREDFLFVEKGAFSYSKVTLKSSYLNFHPSITLQVKQKIIEAHNFVPVGTPSEWKWVICQCPWWDMQHSLKLWTIAGHISAVFFS